VGPGLKWPVKRKGRPGLLSSSGLYGSSDRRGYTEHHLSLQPQGHNQPGLGQLDAVQGVQYLNPCPHPAADLPVPSAPVY
jgi:hypothetical protein